MGPYQNRWNKNSGRKNNDVLVYITQRYMLLSNFKTLLVFMHYLCKHVRFRFYCFFSLLPWLSRFVCFTSPLLMTVSHLFAFNYLLGTTNFKSLYRFDKLQKRDTSRFAWISKILWLSNDQRYTLLKAWEHDISLSTEIVYFTYRMSNLLITTVLTCISCEHLGMTLIYGSITK